MNIDTREVGYYNRYGELVRVRPANDNDLQLDMFRKKQNEQPIAAIEQSNDDPQIEDAEIVE